MSSEEVIVVTKDPEPQLDETQPEVQLEAPPEVQPVKKPTKRKQPPKQTTPRSQAQLDAMELGRCVKLLRDYRRHEQAYRDMANTMQEKIDRLNIKPKAERGPRPLPPQEEEYDDPPPVRRQEPLRYVTPAFKFV